MSEYATAFAIFFGVLGVTAIVCMTTAPSPADIDRCVASTNYTAERCKLELTK